MIDVLKSWGDMHHIPAAAIAELRQLLGTGKPDDATSIPGASEANVQSRIRLRASSLGMTLWRNNSGAMKTATGFVRFGLGNESEASITQYASHDLIGWRPVLIDSRHIGCTIAQFVSIEVKRSAWRWSGDAHERAQAKWMGWVLADGGYSAMVNDPARIDARITNA